MHRKTLEEFRSFENSGATLEAVIRCVFIMQSTFFFLFLWGFFLSVQVVLDKIQPLVRGKV